MLIWDDAVIMLLLIKQNCFVYVKYKDWLNPEIYYSNRSSA